jgi:hypothetical protein
MTDPDASGLSTVELLQKLTDQVGTLVRTEIQLARAEVTAKLRGLAVGAGMFAGAAALLLFALGALVAAAALALALILPAWAAALLTAIALVLVAGVAVLIGRSAIRRAAPPVPTVAIDDVHKDIEAVKAALHAD